MKTMIALTTALALAASVAIAQPGPGRAGKGPGFNFGPSNTRGWSLMTPQERTEHRNKMLSFKTYEECDAYRTEHHKLMEARAKEKGARVPIVPRQNMCERMKQAGRLS